MCQWFGFCSTSANPIRVRHLVWSLPGVIMNDGSAEWASVRPTELQRPSLKWNARWLIRHLSQLPGSLSPALNAAPENSSDGPIIYLIHADALKQPKCFSAFTVKGAPPAPIWMFYPLWIVFASSGSFGWGRRSNRFKEDRKCFGKCWTRKLISSFLFPDSCDVHHLNSSKRCIQETKHEFLWA